MRRLRALAGELFELDREERLIRPGERLPCGQLLLDGWATLAEQLPLIAPRTATPGSPPHQVDLRLERSTRPRAPALLETTATALERHVVTTTSVRLAPLTFAACADGRVLVRGSPLPPIPGRRYWVEGAIATPCGWEWRPAIDAVAVATLIGLAPGELALQGDEGTERLPARAFVSLTRAAIRLTSRRLAPQQETDG